MTADSPGPVNSRPRAPRSSSRVVQALRVAAAASIALVVSEWWHLPHTNLAVWTTHMVMSSHPHTTFQKGLERVVGRGGGILAGTLIASFLGEEKVLALGLESAGLLAFFYAHFCGRLAYTYQNAGLYLQAMLQLGAADPSVAWVNGGWMFLAIVVGVAVAYLVSWVTNAERDLSIVPGEGSLLPLRGEPLARAAQVTATILLAQYVFFALDMPPDANTYSLFMMSVIPDFQKMRERSGHYVGGILAGVAYAVPALLLLNRVPHLPMFVALVALGEYLASYLAQSKGNIQFVGTEMGMIFPLLLVVPFERVQSPYTTVYNIVALFTYTLIAVVVGWAWVAVGLVPERIGGLGGGPSAAGAVRNSTRAPRIRG
jgi:hypothetical protein